MLSLRSPLSALAIPRADTKDGHRCDGTRSCGASAIREAAPAVATRHDTTRRDVRDVRGDEYEPPRGRRRLLRLVTGVCLRTVD